jgi:hypothetical protein
MMAGIMVFATRLFQVLGTVGEVWRVDGLCHDIWRWCLDDCSLCGVEKWTKLLLPGCVMNCVMDIQIFLQR